ncbi:putative N(6)-L-threonylcarbamoyladenine synthase [Sporobolomyces koalae]|uniref:putative N(6)-L-threonylcarbamoyladenine synthase n=1 Tax=Sporobolomyces koalae TaxID=500713 RepID=UPI003171878D
MSLRSLSAGLARSARLKPRRQHSSSASKPIVILGLESSADDSCASVVTSDRQILSNVVVKQSAIHESFGGIHPLHAQEAHQRNLPIAIRSALVEANVELNDLDAIAFTRGPGMYGCLSVCAGAAKALAAASKKPLIGVHHMQAHALTPFLTATESNPAPEFPFLTLLVSGGHTLLLLATARERFEVLATTKDESIGQAFDKVARDLHIPWQLGQGSPGAALEHFAFNSSTAVRADSESSLLEVNEPRPEFPIPFKGQLAFSYAGIRSALTRIISRHEQARGSIETMPIHQRQALAKAFMVSAFAQIEDKLNLGLKKLQTERGVEVKGLVVSGGVASNLYFRTSLQSKLDRLAQANSTRPIPLHFPPAHLCTDNAAMIAWVGIERFKFGRIDRMEHVMQQSKWSIEECESEFLVGTEPPAAL